MLRAALVSTGHEVLRGDTPNTNASWLARRLTAEGILVTSSRTVGDHVGDVAEAIRGAASEADLVVVTGGLGPTEDDRTREALARAAGTPLAEDPAAWALVRAYFERVGRAPQEIQRRQALLPRGATALENREGTAPGVLGAALGRPVWLLPGPPREMRALFEAHVVPALRSDRRLERAAARVVRTAGVPEAEIAAAIEDLMRAPEPVVGTHPDDGEVAVRLLARGEGAEARVDATASEVARRLGPAVVSREEDVRVEHAVVSLLRAAETTIATAESVTGGLVARMLVLVPGASEVFRGGWVTYSDEWKREALGVSESALSRVGAVSQEVARAMAEGALSRSRAGIAIATTGVAGPGPDAHGVPEGTAFAAFAVPGRATEVTALRLAVPREVVQRRTAVAALDLARRHLASSWEDGGRSSGS
jgi:nicotinamide-nucleotide amidase